MSAPACLVAAAPSAAALVVLHCDPELLVLDKPAGLLSVPGRGADKQDCLAARVQAEFPEALVVHRLDMATSGIIVMARSPAAQRCLSRQFMQRQVEKRYLARVAGRLLPEHGDIDLPLAADWPNRPRQCVDLTHGKPSLTRYRTLRHDAETSTLELFPITGRTHQLRVHLQAIGHPILGDALYADARGQASAGRLLLHACHLALSHPRDGVPVAFASAAPF